MTEQLYVFGSNGEGQLGIPAAEIVDTPTLVSSPPPLKNLKAVRSGDNHTLLQTQDGFIFGVGDNRKGQLASQHEITSRSEIFTNLGANVSFIAATCESSAYISVGHEEPRSWITTEGCGQWGELGRGDVMTTTTSLDMEPESLPETLPGTVVDFAAGVWHYVAILDDGSVYGWGKARLGQLGENLTGKVTVPTRIDGIPFKPVKVICGKDFTYLVGDSTIGENIILGRDKFNIVSAKPLNIRGWKDIGATWHGIFILFSDGTLKAWGKENMWNLLPKDLPPIDKIAVGSDHILALTREGKLISWGWGKHGNCGSLSTIKHEVKNDMISGFWNEINIPGDIKAIAAGFCTSFVITQ